MNRRELLRAAVLVPGLSLLPFRRPAASSVDLMASFWAAYDASRNVEDRVNALLRDFFQPHADVYAGAGVKMSESRIAKWLPEFDAMAADVQRLTATFGESYRRHTAHFAHTFPDFLPERAPIYLMPSLFSFDGHIQEWRGRLPLFIGLDGIVRYHGARPDLSVFLDHEAFHLYQSQVNPALDAEPQTALFVTLWIEGGATYVSQLLNPRASRLHVLLDDRPLAEASPATLKAAASQMLERLDSTTDDDAARFFGAGHAGAEPARSGYLVGLTIAERLGVAMKPAAMARLSKDALRPLMLGQLQRLTR